MSTSLHLLVTRPPSPLTHLLLATTSSSSKSAAYAPASTSLSADDLVGLVVEATVAAAKAVAASSKTDLAAASRPVAEATSLPAVAVVSRLRRLAAAAVHRLYCVS